MEFFKLSIMFRNSINVKVWKLNSPTTRATPSESKSSPLTADAVLVTGSEESVEAATFTKKIIKLIGCKVLRLLIND